MPKEKGTNIAKKLFLFSYAAAAALWLLGGLASFAYDRACPPLDLTSAATALVELEREGDNLYRTTGNDPQFLFEGLDVRARRLVVEATFEAPPGEMDVYYVHGGRGGFQPAHRVWPKPLPDGSYVYTLPPGRLTALRFDPGWVSGNRVQVHAIRLNPEKDFAAYFVPTLRTGMALLVLPALGACALCFCLPAVRHIRLAWALRRSLRGGGT